VRDLDVVVELAPPTRERPLFLDERGDLVGDLGGASAAAGTQEVDPILEPHPTRGEGALLLAQLRETARGFAGAVLHDNPYRKPWAGSLAVGAALGLEQRTEVER
jgi:hypothetical protein